MKKILTIVIVVVALQLGVASAALADGGNYHKVRYGETLYGIARHYGSNPYAIAEANGLYNPNYIYAGQVLYIPAGYGYGCNPCDGGYNKYPAQHNYNQCNPCGGYGGNYHQSKYDHNQCNPCGKADHYGYQNMGYNRGGYDNYGKHGGYDNQCGNYGGCDNYGKHGGYDNQCGNYGGCDNYGKHGGYDNYGKHDGKYGYDYTGYYYSYGNQQYSHSCGYNANCW